MHPTTCRALRTDLPVTALAAVLAAAFSQVAGAQFDFGDGPPRPGQQPSATDLVKVQTRLTSETIGPGETIHLAILFDIQKPWHIYWKNPGQGTASPEIRVTGPESFEIGEMRWPRPKVVDSPVGDMFCHEGKVALFVPITAPETLEEGTATLEANVAFAVCDDVKCLFGRRTLTATAATTNSKSVTETIDDAVLNQHQQRLPILIDGTDERASEEPVNAELQGTGNARTLIFTGPAHGFEHARFFPIHSPGVRYGDADVTFEDDRFTAIIELTINPNNFTSGPPSVGGLVGLGSETTDPSYEVAFPLDGAHANQTNEELSRPVRRNQ